MHRKKPWMMYAHVVKHVVDGDGTAQDAPADVRKVVFRDVCVLDIGVKGTVEPIVSLSGV